MKTKLSSINLLNELEKPEYAEVLKAFTLTGFSRNTLLYTPSHEKDLVFIVKTGRVRVYLAFEDKDFSIAILERGDIYTTHTSAYVMSLEDSELLLMPTAVFYRHMSRYPLFYKNILGILGQMLQQTFSIIGSLVFKEVSQRLVDFLLHEAQNSGLATTKGISVTVDLTIEQLAAVIGSSRQTVSTIINQMLKAGTLSRSGRKKYLIPDLDLLKGFPRS